MKYIVVIPARLSSTRLPEKPLIIINGKSLIQRTYEQCIKALPSEQVIIATDSDRILNHCNSLGMNAMMTSSTCLTGTDRVAEIASKINADYYINVQGDEPIINPEDIKRIIRSAEEFQGEVINGYAPINNEVDYTSLTIPKVVFRPDGRLLYMSRSAIPGNKRGIFEQSWRQVCIYAFPKVGLMAFADAKQKTPLEGLEDIEILRFLELGYEVRMIQLSDKSIAVDTPEDLIKVKLALQNEDK